ncbi:MAG: magnesium transporter [Methanomassiliicoccales archaeon]
MKTFFSNNKTVFTLGFTALLISSLGDIMAGVTLGFMTDTLELLPGLMILIPAAIGMRGNIFGALGSRLGTSMHVGTFELSLRKGSILRQNMEASLILTMVVSFLMGFLAKVVSSALGVNSISMQQFIFISVFGGVLAGLVLLVVNVVVANLGFRRNWDIDNISAPLLTAAGDIVTLPMLFLAGILVLNWNGDLAHLFYDLMVVAFFVVTVYLIYEALYRRDEEAKRIFVQSSSRSCHMHPPGPGSRPHHRGTDRPPGGFPGAPGSDPALPAELQRPGWNTDLAHVLAPAHGYHAAGKSAG